jgi:hypothetical protein
VWLITRGCSGNWLMKGLINNLVGFEVIWSDNYDFLWLGSWSISPYP